MYVVPTCIKHMLRHSTHSLIPTHTHTHTDTGLDVVPTRTCNTIPPSPRPAPSSPRAPRTPPTSPHLHPFPLLGLPLSSESAIPHLSRGTVTRHVAPRHPIADNPMNQMQGLGTLIIFHHHHQLWRLILQI